ncbi:MAG: GNAT family N-acetyltransferase [Clostridia bacterium]|nr:GNAT family N-acetyltransferase [Clostridia bacterium]
MMGHPETDYSLLDSIGLWFDGDKIVGAAIYDMYFGEAFIAALPGYRHLLPEIADYAYENLKDENGLGIAVNDRDYELQEILTGKGFVLVDQHETVMHIDIDKEREYVLPEGLTMVNPDPVEDNEAMQWLFWQGFDHGTDFEEFKKTEQKSGRERKYLKKELGIAAQNEKGELVSFCCLWYMDGTDYAYVEPVCTIPSYRGKGIARSLIYEALNRVKGMGADKAYVISDNPFYEKLGFRKAETYTFWWKK